jgi:large subunit ribosomal protein L31
VKRDIHPEYREVLFHDTSVDQYFLIPSTIQTDQTKEWEGKSYPYCPLDISSASHPFYTGKHKLVDTGGRVDKFNKRFRKPSTKAKSEESPVVEEAAAETPVVEEAAAETPVVEEAAAETPVVEEAAAETPVVEEAAVETPVVEEAAAETPSGDESAEEPKS